MITRGELMEKYRKPVPDNYKKIMGKNDIYLFFPTLEAWENVMLTNDQAGTTSRREDYKNWSGVFSWSEYLTILKKGDAKVMKALKKVEKETVIMPSKSVRTKTTGYKMDVTGVQFDIGAVVEGEPESWLEEIEYEISKPKIDITINLTFASSIEKEIIIQNAGMVMGWIKALETTGIQIKVVGINCAENYDTKQKRKRIIVETVIKNYDEPINYQKISSLISPTHLRRGIFYILEIETFNLKKNYGRLFNIDEIVNITNSSDLKKLESKLFKIGGDQC